MQNTAPADTDPNMRADQNTRADAGTAAPTGFDGIDAAVTVLRATAYEHRLRILVRLLDDEVTATALSAALALDTSKLAHHLRHLRAARLVRRQRRGRHVWYRLHDAARPLVLEIMGYADASAAGRR